MFSGCVGAINNILKVASKFFARGLLLVFINVNHTTTLWFSWYNFKWTSSGWSKMFKKKI